MELRPEFSEEAARGFVWEAFPELHEEFGKAAPEPPVKPLAKARTPVTVADAVANAVHAEADRQAWTRWPDRSIEQIRADLWTSPEGQQLYALSKARGGEDWYQARLRKSAEEREAGATYAAIADGMNSDGIPTAQGGVKWWPSTVRAVAVR